MNNEIIKNQINKLYSDTLLEQYYRNGISIILIDKNEADRKIHLSPMLKLNQQYIDQETFNSIKDIFKTYNYILTKKETDKFYVYYLEKN
jgi:hypothetical protein